MQGTCKNYKEYVILIGAGTVAVGETKGRSGRGR